MKNRKNNTLIQNEEQYNEALERLNDIFHADPKTEEGKEAQFLVLLVSD